MFKLYALQVTLMVGSVALIGALPTISDTLSGLMPQEAYVQTFRPVSMTMNANDIVASTNNEAHKIPESMAQIASLDWVDK